MKSPEMTDMQKFYLLGHLDADPKELAAATGLKPATVKKFIKANVKTVEVEQTPVTVNPPLSETPQIPPDRFQPALELMGRETSDGKQRGVSIMTGGAAMAGDDARKAFRNRSADTDDPSYVFRFDARKNRGSS